jgi:hypothetical protein
MTTTTKTRKGRKPANKVAYPHDAPLTDWPVDFDSRKHKPLEEGDFAEECQFVYWDNRAETYKQRMLDAEQQAHLCRSLGSREKREKAAKMAKFARQLERLKAELGDDVTPEMLADLGL